MPLSETQPPKTSTELEAPNGLTNSPEINKSGKITQRAITSVGQAKEIINSLIEADRDASIINSRILAKYNAEKPYNQKKLVEEGLGWRSNFITKPLPQMIEKVAPRFEQAVAGQKYLTNSSFPASVANSSEKTEFFRSELTKTVRALDGWDAFVSDVALDNALFGYTSVAWLDEFHSLPIHFGQDEAWFPDGTKQVVNQCQIAVLKEDYLPHELYDYIKDPESAEAVGWNLENTISVINNAAPDTGRAALTGAGGMDRWFEDAKRELTVGSSYQHGAKVINVYSLLVREVNGKISHYRFAGNGSVDTMKEIYSKDDRFDAMSDCLAFFKFQKGNKKLKGSKGIGRDIYELAAMIDRMRNEVVDRGILSGKMFIQGDFKFLHKFRMSVVGATVLIPNGWTIIEQKVDGNIDSFLKLDAYFGILVDQLIGSVTPRTFQGDRVTKAEVDLFASREEEGKDAKIGRFLMQFAQMMGTIQRRLCNPRNTEPAAKELRKKLLTKMTEEEIDQIAKEPVAGTVRDLTPMQRQMISAFVAEHRGNPLYNQRALELEDIIARLGDDYADRILLPENDPTEAAEQQRLQLMEMALIMQGQPMPVSPRDNDKIHLETIMPIAEQAAAAIVNGQSSTEVFEALVDHIQEHWQNAQKKGMPVGGNVESFLQQVPQIIAQLKQLDAAAQELTEMDPATGEPVAPATAQPMQQPPI